MEEGQREGTGNCGKGPGRGNITTSGHQGHSRAKPGALAGPAPRGMNEKYKIHWPPGDPELLEAQQSRGSYVDTGPPKSEGTHVGPAGTPSYSVPNTGGGCLPQKLPALLEATRSSSSVLALNIPGKPLSTGRAKATK